jgi:hypothetical protein
MQVPRYQRRAFHQRLQNTISAERLMTQMDGDIPQYALMFSILGPTLLQRLPAIVKDGHIQALAKSLVAEPRVEKYQRLSWFVCKPSEPLILGDVGCLFDIVGENKLRSLGGTNEDIGMAYLPIASDCLLVGSATPPFPNWTLRRSINLSLHTAEIFLYVAIYQRKQPTFSSFWERTRKYLASQNCS